MMGNRKMLRRIAALTWAVAIALSIVVAVVAHSRTARNDSRQLAPGTPGPAAHLVYEAVGITHHGWPFTSPAMDRAYAGSTVMRVTSVPDSPPMRARTVSYLMLRPQNGPHSDWCFGRGHREGVARPGDTCWEGAVCIMTNENGHQELRFCMSVAQQSGVHYVIMTDHVTKKTADWELVLVGYVRFSMHHGRDWPFRNPFLDQKYEGYPVMNFHLIAWSVKDRRYEVQRNACIGGVPVSFGIPERAMLTGYGSRLAPKCSPIGEFARNVHDTFMVWHPGKAEPRIIVVNYSNDTPTQQIALTAADGNGTPGGNSIDEVWYVPVNSPALDQWQTWFRRRLHG